MVETKVKHKPYGPYERFFKRPLDIFCSLLAIVVFWWLFVIVAILVRVKLGRPVIFKQQRTGKDDKPFMLYKFRSMTDERDEDGALLPDEVRLTKFGRMLRATSLDELPELFNILTGKMSIVGPRPLPVRYLSFYTEEEKHRHDVRPGLTGWAQVNGRNYVTWEDKFRMDLEYVHNISLKMEMTVFWRSVLVVLKHENIETGSSIEHNGVVYRPLDVERREKHEN